MREGICQKGDEGSQGKEGRGEEETETTEGQRELTFLLVSLCSLRDDVCCRKACWYCW